MLTAAPLTIAKIWKQPKCPSTDEWIKKMWFTYSHLKVAQMVKNAGDPGSTPGSGRSPGKGDGSPLQYSCLENSYTMKYYSAIKKKKTEILPSAQHGWIWSTLCYVK